MRDDLGYEEVLAELRKLLLTVAHAISEGRDVEAAQTCVEAVKAMDKRAAQAMEHAP